MLITVFSNCTSTSKTTSLNVVTAIEPVNVANVMGEINRLLNNLNLSFSQTSMIVPTLTEYVNQYNLLSNLDPSSQEYKNKLKKYKSNALNNLSSNLGPIQYNSFINSLNGIANSSSTNLSKGTVAVLSSLVN